MLDFGTRNLSLANTGTLSAASFDNGSTVLLKTASFTGELRTTGSISVAADSALVGGVQTCSFVSFAGAIPSALSVAGSTQGLRITAPGTYDLTAWTFAGNIADVTVAATTGTVLLITGGRPGLVVNDLALGATFVRQDGVITPVSVVGLTAANVLVINDSGTTAAYVTNQTGSYSYDTPIGSVGTWRVVIDAVGYAAVTFSFSADGSAKVFSGVLSQYRQPSGGAMLTNTTSPYLTVVPNPDGSRLYQRIGNGVVSAQDIFNQTEIALATEDGMHYQANGGGTTTIASLPTGTFVFNSTNVRLIRDTLTDYNATVEAFVQSTDGAPLDPANGGVLYVTVTRSQQLIEYGGMVHIDTIDGTDATAYPYGTTANPVKTWAQAKQIAAFYKITDISVSGTLVLTESAVGYSFIRTNATAIVVLTGTDVSGASFTRIVVTGVCNAPTRGCQMMLCYATNLTGYNGLMHQVVLLDSVEVVGLHNYITQCTNGSEENGHSDIFVSGVGACNVYIRDFHGKLRVEGVSSPDTYVSIGMGAGALTLAANCTDGQIEVHGHVQEFTDLSTGSFVSTTLAPRILDIPTSTANRDAVWSKVLP